MLRLRNAPNRRDMDSLESFTVALCWPDTPGAHIIPQNRNFIYNNFVKKNCHCEEQ